MMIDIKIFTFFYSTVIVYFWHVIGVIIGDIF